MNKSDLLPIEKYVQSEVETYFGSPSVSLVVGVSGGADSMSLMHILHKLGVELHIVHINYQKRGAASDKDAQLVQAETEKKDIDCDIISVEPDEADGQNFQQWARDVRYGAFEAKAAQLGTDGIALAHHRDDQIETILQKIFRGGGLASWSAMQVWNGQLFRPLLSVSRNEIEAYCRDESIPFRDDESNFESDFARNFLRNEWLSELEQHFPGWQENVLRVAEQGKVFASALRYILQQVTDSRDRINRKQFLGLPVRLQKAVILHYIKQQNADEEISRSALKELPKLEALQTGKGLQLTGNMELFRDRDFFKLVIETGDTDSFLELTQQMLQDVPIEFDGLEFALGPYEDPQFSERLYLDADTLNWPLRIRRWQPGDQFQPFSMEGHQSVADHLTNRKVTAAEKDTALVLESFEETICAVIFPPIENRRPPGTISEVVKCSSSTQHCLIINQSQ